MNYVKHIWDNVQLSYWNCNFSKKSNCIECFSCEEKIYSCKNNFWGAVVYWWSDAKVGRTWNLGEGINNRRGSFLYLRSFFCPGTYFLKISGQYIWNYALNIGLWESIFGCFGSITGIYFNKCKTDYSGVDVCMYDPLLNLWPSLVLQVFSH